MAFDGTDIRGLSRLGFDAALGVADLVEQMRRTIGDGAMPLALTATGRTRGIAGLVYKAVRGTPRFGSRGLDAGLRLVAPAVQVAHPLLLMASLRWLRSIDPPQPSRPALIDDPVASSLRERRC